MTARLRDRWWAGGLALAALLLYGASLAPSVATVFDDSLEFQLVGPTLGIAHPTGYPLYTLLAWLFSRLPVGDWAWRVNLLSAVAGALAVGLLFLAARRLGSSRLAALAAASLLALSPTWWSQATVAEVYTLHGLFLALILLLALIDDGRLTVGLAFVTGLALAHHRMTLLLLPGLAVGVLWGNPRLLRQPGQLIKLAVAFLLPLLFYLYLPIRGAAITSLDGSYANTWAGFWRHVLATDYSAFLAGDPLNVQRSPAYPLEQLRQQVGWAGLLLGIVGWLRWREQPRRWTLLALVFAANLLFAAGYRTADAAVFYLPAALVWLLLAAVGLTTLLDQVGAWLAGLGRAMRLPGPFPVWLSGAQAVIVAVMLAGPLQAAAGALQLRPLPRTCDQVLAVGEPPSFSPNRAGDWSALNCGRAMLGQALPQDSTVVGLLGETTLLRYLQTAEGLRGDVQVVTADAEADRLAAVSRAVGQGGAVFVTRELPGLAESYALSAQGPLVQVWPGGQANPALPPPLDVAFGNGVRLVGLELTEVPARGATWIRLNVAWRPDLPLAEDLKVSARLLGADGQVIASADRIPVHWAYPTTHWRPGEVVMDAYDFALPADARIDGLAPLVILYRAADGTEVGRFGG